MQAMIKQAQKMQEDMEKLQSELDVKEHELTAGGGAVKVKIKGNREIVSLELSGGYRNTSGPCYSSSK